MKIIVGLGNPGKQYERTRHNIGFLVADELARRAGSAFRKSWGAKARSCKVSLAGEVLLLVKPMTFMNLSGQAVAPLVRKKGLAASDVIVVVDDTELAFGQLRIRQKGSAGGHNGLKSLIASLGSEGFLRVRIGVGPAHPKQELADYVLSNFSATEKKELSTVVSSAVDAIESILEEGPEKAMNLFN